MQLLTPTTGLHGIEKGSPQPCAAQRLGDCTRGTRAEERARRRRHSRRCTGRHAVDASKRSRESLQSRQQVSEEEDVRERKRVRLVPLLSPFSFAFPFALSFSPLLSLSKPSLFALRRCQSAPERGARQVPACKQVLISFNRISHFPNFSFGTFRLASTSTTCCMGC